MERLKVSHILIEADESVWFISSAGAIKADEQILNDLHLASNGPGLYEIINSESGFSIQPRANADSIESVFVCPANAGAYDFVFTDKFQIEAFINSIGVK